MVIWNMIVCQRGLKRDQYKMYKCVNFIIPKIDIKLVVKND